MRFLKKYWYTSKIKHQLKVNKKILAVSVHFKVGAKELKTLTKTDFSFCSP